MQNSDVWNGYDRLTLFI